MAERSAGILLYRRASEPEVFLGHMGGPYWAGKDAGAWSVPKGVVHPGESAMAAALREFEEEIGAPAPDVRFVHLGDFRYSSGKVVTVFAGESDFDTRFVSGNTFELEWPPRSGRRRSFPEIDEARWMPLPEAATRLVAGQRPALQALQALLGAA